MKKKTTKKKPLSKLHIPKITIHKNSKLDRERFGTFPLEHYSYSSFVKFGANPIMFKINNINGDILDTTSSASSVLGKACHKALQAYLGGDPDYPTPADDGEAIVHGHNVGHEYLKNYSDGFIEYTATIPNRQVLNEKYAFSYFGYIKEFNAKKEIKEVVSVEQEMKYKIDIEGREMPIPLKGYIDVLYLDHKDRLKIRDHKFSATHSNPDKVDGQKLVQAAFNFFLAYAYTGQIPYSITFAEFKTSENKVKDKPQTQNYEIVFAENPLIFDLFYRLYEDITNGILGKMVFVPNMTTMYDNEVALLAYIHRLDVDESKAIAFKEMQVDNVTDFLKKKIQKDGAMKQYLETVSKKFISATNLNYKEMTIQERIKMKLAEHGLGLEFHSEVKGSSITLYRFEPSIGLKMSKIDLYARDIEQVVEVSNIRVLAPIKDSGLIGFEVPNKVRTYPGLPEFNGYNIAVGETITGEVRRYDIRTAPHMLVAGSTGTGKSVWLNNLITQLINTENSEIHLFDPKEVELSHFEGKNNVVEYQSNHKKIVASIQKLVKEMNNRYKIMKDAKVKSIKDLPTMKYKFVVIDEYADLAISTANGVEDAIQMLAQKGRACGIHLIVATQRASTKIINGDIKTNFPVKVVFKMAKEIDSRVMLDESGAEKLLGNGDMLFYGDKGVERLQGYFTE